MKALVLALAVTLSAASVSVAGNFSASTTSTAISTARDLVNTLGLNELQYLKVKGFETTKLAAIETAQKTLTGDSLTSQLASIESAFSTSVMEVLTPAQQKAFLALKSSGNGVLAQAKK